MAAVWALLAARARARPGWWALIAVGVALAAAIPVLTSASTRVASAGALRHGLAGIAAGQRSVTVSYNGFLDGRQLAGADAAVRGQLRRLSPATALRQVVFRRLSNTRGQQLSLGAVDGLAGTVRLVSGRLPVSCAPRRCEVVEVGRQPIPDTAFLDLVVVGRVERTNPLALSGTFDPGADAPLLLAADTEQVSRLEVLQVFQRSWGWVAPVDLDLVGRLGVAGYLARQSDVADTLFRRLEGLIVTAPDDVLRSEDSRARRSGSRFAILGGTSAALVLGLAVIGAVAARRDHLSVLRLLRTRAATPAQLVMFTVAEAGWPVLAGAVLGIGGAAGAALIAWGRPVAGAGLAGGTLPDALLAGAAAVVVAAVLRWRPAGGERGAWRTVGVAAVVAIAVAALAAARGGTAADPGQPADPLLSVLPMLVSLAAGLLAALCWPILPRAARRVVPRRASAWRLALAGAGRQPLRPAATVAVLAATGTAVVFAGAYRSTIEQGAADQAAFAVPMVARVQVGPSLTRPIDLLTPGAVARLGRGAASYPVLRTTGTLSLTTLESAPVELVGLDPAALPRMSRWRGDYSATSPDGLAAGLQMARPVAGPAIPDGATRLTVPATGSTLRLIVLALIHDSTGRSLPITLTRVGDTLTAALPAATGRTLDAVTLQEDVITASLRQHALGEGGTALPARTGQVVLGRPSADGRPLAADLSGWSVTAPSRGRPGAGTLALSYRLTGNATTAAPAQPAVGPVRAYVDRSTAAQARDGVLSLGLGPAARITVRVVATGERFPTTRQRFAVIDRATLAAALDRVTPGSGTATETWVWAPAGPPSRAVERALGQPPYDQLAVSYRSRIEHALRTDPVAVTASRLLLGTAGAGLAIGALCIVLLVAAERRESAGELYAREADGDRPGRLRRVLFTRAAAVVAIGLPVGVASGLILAQATTTLVTVTAAGTTPTPPLVLAAGPALVAAELLVLLGLGLAGAVAVAAGSLRGPLPVPPETDLR